MRFFHPLFVVRLGEAVLGAGRIDEAANLAKLALGLARELGERGHEAYALRLLGETSCAVDDGTLNAAEGYYHEAMVVAADLEMRPLVAHCHLGLGKLYRRVGKSEQAQEHLTTATTMYREMGMTYWLERTEQQLREPR